MHAGDIIFAIFEIETGNRMRVSLNILLYIRNLKIKKKYC